MESLFLEAYKNYADAIFRHCYYRVFDRERAKELMHEAYERTWGEIVGGEDIKNIRAYLYRVANNLVIDEIRKRRPTEALHVLQEKGLEPGHDDRETLARNIEGKKILALLEQLEPEYREAIVMRYVDDLGPKEIAEITGESESAISVRIHRALGHLRNLIEPHE